VAFTQVFLSVSLWGLHGFDAGFIFVRTALTVPTVIPANADA